MFVLASHLLFAACALPLAEASKSETANNAGRLPEDGEATAGALVDNLQNAILAACNMKRW